MKCIMWQQFAKYGFSNRPFRLLRFKDPKEIQKVEMLKERLADSGQ